MYILFIKCCAYMYIYGPVLVLLEIGLLTHSSLRHLSLTTKIVWLN